MPSNARIEPTERLKAARACQRIIGRELSLVYDDIAREPVPNEFLELLHGIEAARSEEANTARILKAR
jgi:hypothetical protein